MQPILIDVPVELMSQRLLIRCPRAGDGAALNAAMHESLKELLPWIRWARASTTVDESEAWVRGAVAKFLAREQLPFFMFLKDGEDFVGGCGLHRIDWTVPRFEIGYWIRTRFSGQGLMSETVEAITRLGFETLKANRMEIHCDDLNRRSWRIAERADYQLEGILRNHVREEDLRLSDTRIYAKISPR